MPKILWMTYNISHAHVEQAKNYELMDPFREIGQNSLDAYATKLEFFLHSNEILAQDNGIGMSEKDFKSRYMSDFSINKIRKRIPPPDWFQGEEKEIMLKRFNLPRGRKGCGRTALYNLRYPYKLLTRCDGEEKVREYTIYHRKAIQNEIEPDGFPDHGVTISIQKPKRKIRDDEVREFMGKAFFPIISNGSSQHQFITPYSDRLFNIFVNGEKVEPKKWSVGDMYDVDISKEETGYGYIKGKIILPAGEALKEEILLYHMGIFVENLPIRLNRSITGFLMEDWLDLITNRNKYLKENRRDWGVFRKSIIDYFTKTLPEPESKPIETSPQIIKSSLQALRRGLRLYQRENFPVIIKRKTRPKVKEDTQKRRLSSAPITSLDLRISGKVATIYFRGQKTIINFDSIPTDNTPYIAVKGERGEPNIITINEANSQLIFIRQNASDKVQSGYMTQLYSLALAEIWEGCPWEIRRFMNTSNEISNNIMKPLIKPE